MKLGTALDIRNMLVGIEARDKRQVIETMIDALHASGRLPDRQKALEAVLAREERMATGMKNGIAIPHGKTSSVPALVACVATGRPVPFGALDGQDCGIFIMTLSPEGKSGPHLEFIAEVSRLFRSEERRAAVLAATTPEQLLAAVAG